MSKFIDDGSPQLVFIDDDDVALWIRPGPVWRDGIRQDERVIWIELQPEFNESNLQGPVLMTKKEWDQLNYRIQKEFVNE